MKKYKVYILTAPNGKRYVGLTCRRVEYRWNNGKGYKTNSAFYADIQKYGWDNIKKTVITLYGRTKEEAYNFESQLINLFNTRNPDKGYNIEDGGKPERLDDRTREKMSAAHKGLERGADYRRHISESKLGDKNPMFGKTGADNPHARAVIATGKDGMEKRYGSMIEARNDLDLPPAAVKNISACCRGKRRSAYGFEWCYG